MITVSDNYNSGKGNNYYEVLGTYAYKANRFTFGYGKVKEGYNCSGGVCRWRLRLKASKSHITIHSNCYQ